MVNPTIKPPHQRGLTASTDTRIVKRVYKGNPSPNALKCDMVYKEVPRDSEQGKAYLAQRKAQTSQFALLFASSISSSTPSDTVLIETRVEFVPQQAWYSPYGDKEWHDFELVDEVPAELK